MKRSFIIILFSFLSYQCSNVLEVAPTGVLAEGLSSEEIADGLVAAAYHGLSANVIDVRAAFVGPSSNWVMDVRSDDAYTGGESSSALPYAGVPQMERGQIFPSDVDGDNLNVPLNKWRNNYVAIARTNDAIRSIKELQSDTYPKTERLAEMYFLRGHFYFDLIRTFNKIAYFTEDDNPLEASNTRYNTDQLWAKIEADFQAAFDNLPTSQEEVARATKYAAAAYLTKLYIETEEWAKAEEKANFVLGGPFGLLNEFEDLSTITFENGPETVFSIQYSRGGSTLGGQEFPNHSWSDLLNTPRGPYSGDGFYLGSQDLANAFRTDANGLPLFDTYNDTDVTDNTFTGNLDPRIDFTFGRVGIPWKQSGVYDETWIRSAATFPYGRSCKKHILDSNDPNINLAGVGPHSASGLNFQLIRYAEVLLWKAEALIEQNKSLDDARLLINDVRLRAKNSTYVKTIDGASDAANYVIDEYPAASWTQDYARKALRFERRLELAMEGHRMYDLIRWGIAEQTMNAYFTIESQRAVHLTGESPVFNGAQLYLPIPQEEIDLAPHLYEQNSGY